MSRRLKPLANPPLQRTWSSLTLGTTPLNGTIVIQTQRSLVQPYRINYATIAEAVKEVPLAICNRIDGERKPDLERVHLALPMIAKWTTRVAMRTFEGARHLAGEDERDPERRFRTAVCIPPLTRSILENLFSVTFLFDRPQENTRWYLASAWRDARGAYDSLLERHRNDPEYNDWLKDYAAMVDSMATDAAITAQEQKDPDLVRVWPSPGQMTHGQAKGGVDQTQDPQRRTFLRHLRKWYYGELSADAHLSGFGFVRRGGLSLLVDDPDQTRQAVRISQTFFALLTVYVAFLSEIVGELQFLHEAVRLRQIWDHIKRWPDAEDLFTERYDAWLPARPIASPPRGAG